MNRERIKDLARFCGFDWQRYWDEDEENQLEVFANLIEAEQTNQFNPDCGTVAPMVEEQQRMAARIEELENALSQLLAILGPTAPTCCGCATEWQAAIDLIRKELE